MQFGGVNQANKITAKWKRKLENRKRSKAGTGVINLVATSSFWREEDEHITTDEASDKVVMMPTGVTTNASAKALHPNTRLKKASKRVGYTARVETQFITKCMQII